MSIYDLSKNPHIQLPEAEIFIQVHYKQIKTPKFFQNQAPQISFKYTTSKSKPPNFFGPTNQNTRVVLKNCYIYNAKSLKQLIL